MIDRIITWLGGVPAARHDAMARAHNKAVLEAVKAKVELDFVLTHAEQQRAWQELKQRQRYTGLKVH